MSARAHTHTHLPFCLCLYRCSTKGVVHLYLIAGGPMEQRDASPARADNEADERTPRCHGSLTWVSWCWRSRRFWRRWIKHEHIPPVANTQKRETWQMKCRVPTSGKWVLQEHAHIAWITWSGASAFSPLVSVRCIDFTSRLILYETWYLRLWI